MFDTERDNLEESDEVSHNIGLPKVLCRCEADLANWEIDQFGKD